MAFHTLTGRTEKCASANHHHSLNLRTARRTRFSFPAIDRQRKLEIPCLAVAVYKIIEGCAAFVDGVAQYSLHVSEQVLLSL